MTGCFIHRLYKQFDISDITEKISFANLLTSRFFTGFMDSASSRKLSKLAKVGNSRVYPVFPSAVFPRQRRYRPMHASRLTNG